MTTDENVFAIMYRENGNKRMTERKDLTIGECRNMLESEGYHESTFDNRIYEKTTEQGRVDDATIMRVRF